MINETLVIYLKLEVMSLNNYIIIQTLADCDLKVYHYVNVTVNIDGVERSTKMYIINKSIMNVDALIGQNFTELDDVHYEKSDEWLIFKSCDPDAGKINETNIKLGNVDEHIPLNNY